MLIELKTPMHPDEPGLICYELIVPEDMKLNPECPCQARTCPKHGFCRYCKTHHDENMRARGLSGADRACRRQPEELTWRDNAFTCGAGCEEGGN